MKRAAAVALVIAAVAALVSVVAGSASRTSPQERRGKEIYLRGASQAPITAVIADGLLEVPASTVPCVNCHGHDGRGKPEGGLTPANITWESLATTFVDPATGRARPGYAERSIARAITQGLDAAGNTLAAVMPRYRLSREDATDLVAYLKRLGIEEEPGLSETSVRVGTTLPATGPFADMGRAVRAVLTAYFDEVNRQGGIYSRRLELRVAEAGDATTTRATFERLIQDADVFALVGAFIAGAEREVAALVEREDVPLIGPLAASPQIGGVLNRQIFYVFPGVAEQARVLLKFAAQKRHGQSAHVAIVAADDAASSDVVDRIRRECRSAGWTSVTTLTYVRERFEPARLIRQARDAGAAALVVLGGAEPQKLAAEADRLKWTPSLLLPAARPTQALLSIPSSFKDRVFLSFPTLPADHTAFGLSEYRALVEAYQLPDAHRPAQLATYGAAKILVEGLKRGGRELNREKLVTALEGLYEFETGVTPPITYSPIRRIGALGAHIVTVDPDDKGLRQVGGWVRLE